MDGISKYLVNLLQKYEEVFALAIIFQTAVLATKTNMSRRINRRVVHNFIIIIIIIIIIC